MEVKWHALKIYLQIYSYDFSQSLVTSKVASLWQIIFVNNNVGYWKMALKVTPTTFYEISKISHICSNFRKSVYIRVVHIFWDRASFIFPLFPRKEGQNSENLWMTYMRYFLNIFCIFFAYWRTAEKILLFNLQKV